MIGTIPAPAPFKIRSPRIVNNFNIKNLHIRPLLCILHRSNIRIMSKDDFPYDDDDAVKFIRNYLPEELKNKFSDDDINYIIDLIYDFYNSKGFLEGEDDDKEIEINEDELASFVVKNALSDGIGTYDANDISLIVQGEMEYCDSIGMFE